MKLSIFDRLLLFLSMIVFFAVGIGIVVVYTAKNMSFADIGYELDVFLDEPYGIIIVILAALILLFVSVKLIIAAFTPNRPHEAGDKQEGHYRYPGSNEGNEVLIKSTEVGDIVVSPSVIKELAIRKAKMSDRVKDVHCRVERNAEGSKLFMRFVLMADVKMEEFMVPMQEEIKNYVQDLTGTTVTGVEIGIDASEPKQKVRVR